MAVLVAQPVKPVQAQSSSSISYASKDGAATVEIRNVTYEVTDARVPGRPPNERLVLRKTVQSKHVIDDIGVEATLTLEAWPLGVDLKQKPIYSVALAGVDGQTMDGALWVASRGAEEVEWWSVHKLGTGQHLFDTYVPLVRFSISRETLTLRYVGLETPPDDTADKRPDGRAIKISFSQNYPSAPNTTSLSIPILRDELDLAHAQLPPRVHVAAWRR